MSLTSCSNWAEVSPTSQGDILKNYKDVITIKVRVGNFSGEEGSGGEGSPGALSPKFYVLSWVMVTQCTA